MVQRMLQELVIGLVIVLVAACVLIYRFAYAPYDALKKIGVNGPVPRAFWGNVDAFVKDRIGMMDELRKTYGNVFGFYIGALPVIAVFDMEILKLITVKHFDAFTDHIEVLDPGQLLGLPPNLLESKGENWRRDRHSISPTFTLNKLKQMIPIVQQCIDKTMKQIGDFSNKGQTIEIWRTFGTFTMESILAVAFGRQVDLHSSNGKDDQLLISAKTLFDTQKTGGNKVDIFTGLAVGSQCPPLKHFAYWFMPKEVYKSLEYLVGASETLIQARKHEDGSTKHNDFLQLLLDLETVDSSGKIAKEKAFTMKKIITHCLTFLLAGYETTANCISFTSYLLATNPEVQEKLCQEIDSYFADHSIDTDIFEATQNIEYLDMVIQESLRYYPPAYLVSRMCTQDIQMPGLSVSKGTAVFIPIMNIHHDKDIWESPESFKPERFSPEEKGKRPQMSHIPFGWGPRSCIGMRFALLEVKMMLITILLKHRFVTAPETEIPLKLTTGITLSPKNNIYLKIEPRS